MKGGVSKWHRGGVSKWHTI